MKSEEIENHIKGLILENGLIVLTKTFISPTPLLPDKKSQSTSQHWRMFWEVIIRKLKRGEGSNAPLPHINRVNKEAT